MKLIVPLSQLESHPKQRALNQSHADNIRKSFGNDPAQHMLTHPAIGIPYNPELFPQPPVDRASFFILRDYRCRVTLLDGQHRIKALKDLCTQSGVRLHDAFWLTNIVHPGERYHPVLRKSLNIYPVLWKYPHVIDLVMSRSNIQLDQESTLLVDQLLHSINAAFTQYSHNLKYYWPLHVSFASISKQAAGIDASTRDQTTQDLIKRITSCDKIVTAATASKICEERFQQWRVSRDGLNLILFLYTLQRSDLGPVSHVQGPPSYTADHRLRSVPTSSMQLWNFTSL